VIELAAESLRVAGRLRLRVGGSSMLPAIRPGDILEVRARRAADVHPGSVVLFQRGGRLFAHRVVHREGAFLVTRGDALDHPDAAIGAAQLLGEVIAVERRGRTVAARPTPRVRAAAFLFRRSALAARLFMRLSPA